MPVSAAKISIFKAKLRNKATFPGTLSIYLFPAKKSRSYPHSRLRAIYITLLAWNLSQT